MYYLSQHVWFNDDYFDADIRNESDRKMMDRVQEAVTEIESTISHMARLKSLAYINAKSSTDEAQDRLDGLLSQIWEDYDHINMVASCDAEINYFLGSTCLEYDDPITWDVKTKGEKSLFYSRTMTNGFDETQTVYLA